MWLSASAHLWRCHELCAFSPCQPTRKLGSGLQPSTWPPGTERRHQHLPAGMPSSHGSGTAFPSSCPSFCCQYLASQWDLYPWRGLSGWQSLHPDAVPWHQKGVRLDVSKWESLKPVLLLELAHCRSQVWENILQEVMVMALFEC